MIQGCKFLLEQCVTLLEQSNSLFHQDFPLFEHTHLLNELRQFLLHHGTLLFPRSSLPFCQGHLILSFCVLYGVSISIEEVDAPTSPELTQRYQVFTVPTTVVLDATGHAHANNYGFANTQRLLEQVDEVLALVGP